MGAQSPLRPGPVLALPAVPYVLVHEVGLIGAIILERLNILLADPRQTKAVNGRLWIGKTIEQWCTEEFPFLCERSMGRQLQELEREGQLLSCQPDGIVSRRKYYTLPDRERASTVGSMQPASEHRSRQHASIEAANKEASRAAEVH